MSGLARCRVALGVFVSAMSLVVMSPGAWADDFVVHNTVEAGQQPVESITIFRGELVYDILQQPTEIVVLNPSAGTCFVLDPERLMKTEVSMQQVDAFTARLKSAALQREVPLLAFLADPKFEETYDPAIGKLALTSNWLTYKVTTATAKQPAAADRYAEYSHWQTKLNVLMRPGSLPPFARLALNERLGQLGALPDTVEMTRYARQTDRKPLTMRSRHRVEWVLDSEAARLADEADALIASLPSVSLAEFQQASQIKR